MKGKGNDGSGNNVERDSWRTSQELWDHLDKQYHFEFDCCATTENSKCQLWSFDFEKVNPFVAPAWMNPPFSIARKMFEHFFKTVIQGVAIFRCDNMETKVWQEVILKNAHWIFIPTRRWSYTSFEFERPEGKGTRFPSALIGIGVEPPRGLQGTTLWLREASEE